MNLINLKPKSPGSGQPAFVNHASEAVWFDAIPGERLSIRVHSGQVGGRFSIMESISGPGSASPIHTHAEDETFHVLEGRPTFAVDGKVFDAEPGSVVVVPANTPHAWKNRSDGNVRMLAIFTPGGIEDLFTKIAGLSPDEIAELAATCGTVVLGPPLAD